MADSMTETSKLRALLDGRGVEYEAGNARAICITEWADANGRQARFVEYYTGETRFVMDCLKFTPEQAVAATLGNHDHVTRGGRWGQAWCTRQ